MYPVFDIQTFLFCLSLAWLASFYALSGLFGAFYLFSSHQWRCKKHSSFSHQYFQPIINQQSIPSYILDAFCGNNNFCSFPHLLQNLTPIRVHFLSHLLLNTCISYKVCLISIICWNALLKPSITLFFSTILVLQLALLHSSLTSLIMSNAAFLSVIF